MVIGAALLLYVGSEYYTMYAAQKNLAREFERQNAAVQQQVSQVADDGLTRISIPKINLNAIIVEGTSHRALLKGPGHVKDTPAPGNDGNSVITGHRDTFFRHIHELDQGDELLVQRSGKTFKYEVIGKKVVQPDDLSVLKPSADKRLTLITCYPTYYIGPAPERLVVFTKLAGEDGTRAKAAGAGISH